MDIKVAAVLLAIICVIGIALCVYVLRIQIPLLRVEDTKLLKRVRYALFLSTVVITLGLFIMLSIDFATFAFNLRRSTDTINPIGVVVTFLGPLVMLLSIASTAMWYWLIKRDNAAAARMAGPDDKSDILK